MYHVCSSCACLPSQLQGSQFPGAPCSVPWHRRLSPTPQVRTHSPIPLAPPRLHPRDFHVEVNVTPESWSPLPLPLACFSLAHPFLCSPHTFLPPYAAPYLTKTYLCLSLPLFLFVVFSLSIYLYPCFSLSPYPSCILSSSFTSFPKLPDC